MLNYHYVLNDGELKINKKCPSISDLKTEVIEHTSELIHSCVTYPDGFMYESKVYCDKIELWTNRELSKCPDGTFNVLDK